MPYDRSAFITRTPVEGVCFDYMQGEEHFIADKIFTPKAVDKKTVKVFQADTSKLRNVDTRNKTNAEAPLIDEQLFATNVTLEEHKLAKEVDPVDVRDADIPEMVAEGRAARVVTHSLLLAREILAATAATTAANYPTALKATLASGSRWNESGGTPEADKITADAALINACGAKANAMAMDWATYAKLRTSPEFRDRCKFTQAGPVTKEAMMAFFDVEYLNIGRARYNTAVEGAAVSISSVWSTFVLAYVYNPSPAIESVSYGHMYLMKAPFWSKTSEDPKRNGPAGSMKRVEVGTEYKLGPGYVVSSSDSDFSAGYLWTTAVS